MSRTSFQGCAGPPRDGLLDDRKEGSITVLEAADRESQDWRDTTDQINKHGPFSSFSSFSGAYLGGNLVFFKLVLTRSSISDETRRTIRQLEVQSARDRVLRKLKDHDHWERKDNLQEEVRRTLRTDVDKLLGNIDLLGDDIGGEERRRRTA